MGSRRKADDSVRPPVVSRRALICAGSAAAMANGFGGEGSTAVERRHVNLPGRQRCGAADRRLSFAFRGNAYGYYRAAVGAEADFPEISCHSLAIAIELSLKAYLLHRGVSDDWNRVHIAHDLWLALACARRAGLRQIPQGLPSLASSLTPFYEHHAFGRSTTATMVSLDLPQACETVRGLLSGVDNQIDHEVAIDGWRTRLCREAAHA